MAQATIIYNPLAGPQKWEPAIREVSDLWRSYGWRLTVQATTHAGHATELARQAAADGRDLVLMGGGDGTLGEVVNGLADSDTILALLPMGTGNSFAKELGMTARLGFYGPERLLKFAQSLLKGRVHEMDVGYARGDCCPDGRHWLLWASAGMDSYVVDQIEPRSKLVKRLGPLGYIGEGLPAMPKFGGMTADVEIDGRRYSGDYLMVTVSNCRLYGGGELNMNPTAVLDDGAFEVWLFGGKAFAGKEIPDPLTAMQYLFEMALGRHAKDPNVQKVVGQKVRIATQPILPFHLDGDPVGKTPFTCEIKPRALRLLVPPTAPEGLFGRMGRPL
jgi:diacylglycerol kinase (ATP)